MINNIILHIEYETKHVCNFLQSWLVDNKGVLTSTTILVILLICIIYFLKISGLVKTVAG